jgi:hypothetical protein
MILWAHVFPRAAELALGYDSRGGVPDVNPGCPGAS